MAKRNESIEIPLSLARLLIIEPEDMKGDVTYEDVNKLAKTMLKLLIEAK